MADGVFDPNVPASQSRHGWQWSVLSAVLNVPLLHPSHTRLRVLVASKTTYSPGLQTVVAAHFLSNVAVGAAVSYSFPEHTVNAVHTLSEVAVGAAVSYSVAEQIVIGEHSLSEAAVGAIDSYSVALQIVTGKHSPFGEVELLNSFATHCVVSIFVPVSVSLPVPPTVPVSVSLTVAELVSTGFVSVSPKSPAVPEPVSTGLLSNTVSDDVSFPFTDLECLEQADSTKKKQMVKNNNKRSFKAILLVQKKLIRRKIKTL